MRANRHIHWLLGLYTIIIIIVQLIHRYIILQIEKYKYSCRNIVLIIISL